MSIGTKRLFPLEASQPVTFSDSDGYDWKLVEPSAKFACVLGGTFDIQDSCSYRKYRLRVTYYDSLPSTAGANIQLSCFSEGSFPPGVLTRDILDLPPANCLFLITSTTAFTPWFTIGFGSNAEIWHYLNTNGSLSIRLAGAEAGSSFSAKIYTVDLECWDFTSPTAINPAPIPAGSTLVWTREIVPQNGPITVSSSGGQSVIVSQEFGIGSATNPENLPTLYKNFNRVFKIRGAIKTLTGYPTFTVHITDANYNSLYSWDLSGFPSQTSVEIMLMGPSISPKVGLWDPGSGIPDQCYFVALYPGGGPVRSGMIYALTLEVHDMSTLGEAPMVRTGKVFERPIPLDGSGIPHSQRTPHEYQVLQNPFHHGTPYLSSQCRRSYVLRVSCLNQVTSSQSKQEGLSITLEELASLSRSVTFEVRLPAGGKSNSFTCFDISAPLYFGDGRGPAIPDSNWQVQISYIGDDADSRNICKILDLSLEAHDRPVVDVHLPLTQRFSLLLSGTCLSIPPVPEISFQSSAFSVTAWVANAVEYYDLNDEPNPDGLKHIIIQHGYIYWMGLKNDGTVFASLQLITGDIVTAVFPDNLIPDLQDWVHIALIWDTRQLWVAVNGLFIEQATTNAAGPLAGASPVPPTILGGNSFAGRIYNVAFWNKALSQDELRDIKLNSALVPPSLILNLEFTSNDLLVNAPGVANWSANLLASTTTMSLYNYVLAIAPPGCANTGNHPALHMKDKDSFTVEAWIAPVVAQSNTSYTIAEKLGPAADVYGWGLRIEGATLVAQRRADIVRSTRSLVIQGDSPKWVHVAVVFYAVGSIGTLTLFIDGKQDSQINTSTIPPSTDVDGLEQPFIIGGSYDITKVDGIVTKSFYGYIDTVRVWRAARWTSGIRNSMYNAPDPNSPALAAEFSFGLDQISPTTNYGNASVSQQNQTVTIADMKQFRPLPGVSQDQDSLPVIAVITISDTAPLRDSRILAREMRIKDSHNDESTTLWINFGAGIFKALIEVVGFNISHGDLAPLEELVYELWESEVVRAALVAFANVNPGSGGSSNPTPNPSDVIPLVVNVAEATKGAGKLTSFCENIPSIGWWDWMEFLEKFEDPAAGEAFLQDSIQQSVAQFVALVKSLLQKIQADPKTNGRPGLSVKWVGGPVQKSSMIPLQAGTNASPQTLSVSLSPPSYNGPVIVTVATGSVGIFELSPHLDSDVGSASFTFQEGDGASQSLNVRALHPATQVQMPWLEFRMAALSGEGIMAGFDPRLQRVIMTPEVVSLNPINQGDKAIITVSMASILDVGETITVAMSDQAVPPDKDPAPTKELTFDRTSVTFASPQQRLTHASTAEEVWVSLKSKPSSATDSPDPIPIIAVSGSKRKRAGGQSDDNDNDKASVLVAITEPHETIITMVRAGKGDSYIVSDRRGGASTSWKRILIDGGVRGTWSRIEDALKDLTKTTNIGDITLDALICTHYDQDHISGLLEMMELKAGVGRPRVDMALFNDCNPLGQPHIIEYKGDPSTNLTDSILDSAEMASPQILINPDTVDSQKQGVNLYNLLIASEVMKLKGLFAPRGRPPAMQEPSRNDLPDIFAGLKSMITGPTTANVKRMWSNPTNGVYSNRTSTILTLATKPQFPDTNPSDVFSALFPGDAHDHLLDRIDIRGVGHSPQHFLVMKVPHHGSRHSEDEAFYKAYTADYYLISTNWNSHKHPTFNTIKFILEGYEAKQKKGKTCKMSPTIITTSQKGIPRGIDLMPNGLLTTAFKKMLTDHQAAMYCFQEGVPFVHLSFKNGELNQNLDTLTGLYRVPAT